MLRCVGVDVFQQISGRGGVHRLNFSVLPDMKNAKKFAATAKCGLVKINVFTPQEMAALLKHASNDLLPVIAIAGFAGVRAARNRASGMDPGESEQSNDRSAGPWVEDRITSTCTRGRQSRCLAGSARCT